MKTLLEVVMKSRKL